MFGIKLHQMFKCTFWRTINVVIPKSKISEQNIKFVMYGVTFYIVFIFYDQSCFVLQSNFFNANIDSVNSSLARRKFKVPPSVTIISLECNSLIANFISVKTLLIRGEILVPTPNNSSIVCSISTNCRRWRRCGKTLAVTQ